MNSPGPGSAAPLQAKTSVFVSYSRRQKGFVEWLKNELEQHGIDVWVDLEDIKPTEDWGDRIERGIEQCDFFLFVISPQSVVSPVCLRELESARRFNKRLAPVLLENSDSIPECLAGLQFTFFNQGSDPESALERLAKALTTDLEWVRNHTRFLNRALEWDQGGRRRSKLIWGRPLRESEEWLAKAEGKETSPTDLHREYISASRRFVTRMVAVGVCLATLTFLSVAGLLQLNQAWRKAATVTELIGKVNSEQRDMELAGLLGVEAARRIDAIAWPWRHLPSMRSLASDSRDALNNALTRLPERLAHLQVDGSRLRGISFDAEGDVAAPFDLRTIWIWHWKTASLRPWPQDRKTTAAVFAASGRRIATGGQKPPVRVYEISESSPRLIQELAYPDGAVVGLSSCLDETGEYLLAAIQSDVHARVNRWRWDGSEFVQTSPWPILETNLLSSFSASRDCQLLSVVRSRAGDATQPQPWVYWRGDPGPSALPTPETGSREAPPDVKITVGNVEAVAIAAGDHRYAMALTNKDDAADAANAGAVVVGDYETHAEMAILPFRAVVRGLAFDGGTRLATAAVDGTIQIWESKNQVPQGLDREATVEAACHLLTRNLSAEQWRKYFPGEERRSTCRGLPLSPNDPE